MSIGFVYILLNPAFPKQLKIGRTARESGKRARELSRQTGVPNDFIVIYDELVSDAPQVEAIVHERLDGFRLSKSKEFFVVPPKDAILALREVASTFPVPPSSPRLVANLYPHFVANFGPYLDPQVVGIRFVQLPGAYYLEVDRQTGSKKRLTTSVDDVPLGGLEAPDDPTPATLGANEGRLRACDAYDWANIGNVFPPETARRIADEWERPGGLLENLRKQRT